MSALFSPYELGRLGLSNRIVIAPMCQYSATDGNASEWHQIHLGHLLQSGAGLLIIEATAVSPEGRISPFDLGLWSAENQNTLAHVLAAGRRYSTMPVAIQLAHAGRKASVDAPWRGGKPINAAAGGWQTLAPSALSFDSAYSEPRALDRTALRRLRDDFASAAKRAAEIGIDAIEIHGAHGYLLHQFLSPLANQRTDEYGGALANRLRFPLEIFDAVRAAFPAERPVGMRISATDWVADGWSIEQSEVLAAELKARGADFIHVSSGGLSPQQKMTPAPGYQLGFAEQIKRATGLATIGVGLVTEPSHADAVIANGQADLVALGRGMLYNPRWPWHAAAELGAKIEAPPQYWRSLPQGQAPLFKPQAS